MEGRASEGADDSVPAWHAAQGQLATCSSYWFCPWGMRAARSHTLVRRRITFEKQGVREAYAAAATAPVGPDEAAIGHTFLPGCAL